MTPAQANHQNVMESVSGVLAGALLTAGYIVYWHRADAVQTPDGWYMQYSQQRTTYLADTTFKARYDAAPALVTLTDALPANPRHIIRPTTDGSVGAAEAVTLPVLSIEVGDAVAQGNYELGTRVKNRARHLVIDGLVRSAVEVKQLADGLAIWLDEETSIDVLDHSGGTRAVLGQLLVLDQRVDSMVWPEEVEEKRFQVLLNARLEYVA